MCVEGGGRGGVGGEGWGEERHYFARITKILVFCFSRLCSSC